MKYTLALLAASACAFNNGGITVMENGQETTRYIISADWADSLIDVSGNSVTLRHNARAYLATNASDNFDPNNYHQFVLKDKTLSFDVTLADISCSCNAALYTVSMPGYNWSGQPDPSSGGDYYCDANQVGGVWCWEMDIMEANKYVVQTTPHKCW